jgi:hypothetical protein
MKTTFIRFTAAFALLLLAMAANPALPQLFVLGDSHSIQYGTYLKYALRQDFEYGRKGESGDVLQSKDANGRSSAEVLHYLQAAIATGKFKPDVLLLNCGMHDLRIDAATGKHDVPLAEYERNLKAIFTLLKENNIKTVWVRTAPVNDLRHANKYADGIRRNSDVIIYNRVADKVCNQFDIQKIDLYKHTLSLKGNLWQDHVHFNHEVRKSQAAYIAAQLTQREFNTFLDDMVKNK